MKWRLLPIVKMKTTLVLWCTKWQKFLQIGCTFFFCVPQLCLWGSPSWGEIFAYETVFYSNHWGSHIQSLWMVHAGCVFVASIHPSRTWMSGSVKSVRWNACVHRLDLGLYSHLKELGGGGVGLRAGEMESEPMLTPREKSPLPEKKKFPRGGSNQQCHITQDSEPYTTNELFRPLDRMHLTDSPKPSKFKNF